MRSARKLDPGYLAGIFGPYKVGDFVEEGIGFYGVVVGAGPRTFRVQWENATRNVYRQDYRGIRRAHWPEPEYGERKMAELSASVRPWAEP